MRLVLLRHAAVEVEPAVLPALWQLSDEGRAGARTLAREPVWREIERIYTSPEVKAQETAQIIAGPNDISVTVVEGLREVARPHGQWFGDEYPGGYEAAVAAYYAGPNEPVHGWEPAARARTRICACIDALVRAGDDAVAIAGHGLTLSLYLAAVIGAEPLALWRTITLPDLAVVDVSRRELLQPFGRWRVALPPA
jgi:broad specificity phosphatase PhoE